MSLEMLLSLEFHTKLVHTRNKLTFHQFFQIRLYIFCLKSANPKRKYHVLIVVHMHWNLSLTTIFHMAFLILFVPCTLFHSCVPFVWPCPDPVFMQNIFVRGKRVAALIYTDNRAVNVGPVVLWKENWVNINLQEQWCAVKKPYKHAVVITKFWY